MFTIIYWMNEKTIKPKCEIGDLSRTADLRRTSSKGDSTNWSYKNYKCTETVNHTILSYKIDDFKKRYKEALLKKTELTLKVHDKFMKKLNMTLIKSDGLCQSLLIETILFVNTTTYQFSSLGTTQSNLNSFLTG